MPEFKIANQDTLVDVKDSLGKSTDTSSSNSNSLWGILKNFFGIWSQSKADNLDAKISTRASASDATEIKSSISSVKSDTNYLISEAGNIVLETSGLRIVTGSKDDAPNKDGITLFSKINKLLTDWTTAKANFLDTSISSRAEANELAAVKNLIGKSNPDIADYSNVMSYLKKLEEKIGSGGSDSLLNVSDLGYYYFGTNSGNSVVTSILTCFNADEKNLYVCTFTSATTVEVNFVSLANIMSYYSKSITVDSGAKIMNIFTDKNYLFIYLSNGQVRRYSKGTPMASEAITSSKSTTFTDPCTAYNSISQDENFIYVISTTGITKLNKSTMAWTSGSGTFSYVYSSKVINNILYIATTTTLFKYNPTNLTLIEQISYPFSGIINAYPEDAYLYITPYNQTDLRSKLHKLSLSDLSIVAVSDLPASSSANFTIWNDYSFVSVNENLNLNYPEAPIFPQLLSCFNKNTLKNYPIINNSPAFYPTCRKVYGTNFPLIIQNGIIFRYQILFQNTSTGAKWDTILATKIVE